MAEVLARATHRLKAVDNGRLEPNQALAFRVGSSLEANRAERERGGESAGLMAIRIKLETSRRPPRSPCYPSRYPDHFIIEP